MLLNEPAGTVARTIGRDRVVGGASPVNGSVYMRMIVLPAGFTASAMTMTTRNSAKTGGTHGWYVITDQYMNVLAVTADQTDAATTWGTTYTPYKLPFANTWGTAYTGIYYAGVMVAETAGTIPAFMSSAAVLSAAYNALPPVLCGNSGAGLTTPPPIGSQLAVITASAGANLYITLQSS